MQRQVVGMNAIIDLRNIRAAAEMLAPMCDGDEDLLHDMMDGETDIVRIVSRLHEQVARDGELLLGIKDRKAALLDREQRIAARQDAFKRHIGMMLRAAHLTKLELPEVTYSVREGSPKLVIVDPDAVPAEWCRTKAEPDKAKINEAFANAETLPNWLTVSEAKDIVTARTK
jgi:hypothetical protein